MRIIFLKAIQIYQNLVSPFVGFFGFKCRFYPSCSDYAKDAIKNFGVLKGSFKSIGRLIRCGPWSKGGIDYLKIKL